MNVETRQKIERAIIERIVTDAISVGYAISVNDGEETTLRRSRDTSAIMAAMMTTDEDRLLIHRPSAERYFGWVYLVYGNDGWDVVNDYTTNLESLMAGADKVAGEFEKQYG
jgi:hypothetical protein